MCMVDIDTQPMRSCDANSPIGSSREDVELQVWLARDLARRNNLVLREELPIELQALVMLFKV